MFLIFYCECYQFPVLFHSCSTYQNFYHIATLLLLSFYHKCFTLHFTVQCDNGLILQTEIMSTGLKFCPNIERSVTGDRLFTLSSLPPAYKYTHLIVKVTYRYIYNAIT